MPTTWAPRESSTGGVVEAWRFFLTVPPPGDITWLGEVPRAGPLFCLCHTPFVTPLQ